MENKTYIWIIGMLVLVLVGSLIFGSSTTGNLFGNHLIFHEFLYSARPISLGVKFSFPGQKKQVFALLISFMPNSHAVDSVFSEEDDQTFRHIHANGIPNHKHGIFHKILIINDLRV